MRRGLGRLCRPVPGPYTRYTASAAPARCGSLYPTGAALFEALDRDYAVDDEGRLAGLRYVAVPVRTSEGRVLGAISVSSPRSRTKGDRLKHDLPEVVQNAANVVELDANDARVGRRRPAGRGVRPPRSATTFVTRIGV